MVLTAYLGRLPVNIALPCIDAKQQGEILWLRLLEHYQSMVEVGMRSPLGTDEMLTLKDVCMQWVSSHNPDSMTIEL